MSVEPEPLMTTFSGTDLTLQGRLRFWSANPSCDESQGAADRGEVFRLKKKQVPAPSVAPVLAIMPSASLRVIFWLLMVSSFEYTLMISKR